MSAKTYELLTILQSLFADFLLRTETPANPSIAS